jgi:hypothetical protein
LLSLSSALKVSSSASPCMDMSVDGSKLAMATAEGEVVVRMCRRRDAPSRRSCAFLSGLT